MSDRIRFAIVGAGRRSREVYGPLLKLFKKDVELVGVWSRSSSNARQLGEQLNVLAFDDLEQLQEEVHPDAAIVSVSYAVNGMIGKQVVELGMHALLETPVAHELTQADAIMEEAAKRDLKVEVSEQYYRRPMERLKGKMIEAGIFGKVFTAYNDFLGHGYHGVSLIRSYIGFDVPILAVSGSMAKNQLPSHYAWIEKTDGPREEQWEHAVLHFADGRLGFFNWSSVAYDSALRWLRSTKFFAERGMAVGDRLTLLTSDGKDPLPIQVIRTFHNVGGMETLRELVACTEPEIVWRNPFRGIYMDDEMIAVADCVMSLIRAIREDDDPEYGLEQARLDQEVTLAMYASARRKGEPVELPLKIKSD
jgi:predicted dehydrogenase